MEAMSGDLLHLLQAAKVPSGASIPCMTRILKRQQLLENDIGEGSKYAFCTHLRIHCHSLGRSDFQVMC